MVNPRFPEVVDFPRCNNADTDWYVRMPTDPPLFDSKVEMLLKLCKKECAILVPAFPTIDSVYIEMGRNVF